MNETLNETGAAGAVAALRARVDEALTKVAAAAAVDGAADLGRFSFDVVEGTKGARRMVASRVASGRAAVVVETARGFEGWAAQALLDADLIVEWSGRLLVVTDGRDASGNLWYARTVRAAGDGELADASRLELAWAVRSWAREEGPLAGLWRHVLECDAVTGAVDVGMASMGACETCYHEYAAVLFWVSCSCGLVRIGSSRDLFEAATDNVSLSTVLAGMDEVRDDYLAAVAAAAAAGDTSSGYACWTGFSVRNR